MSNAFIPGFDRERRAHMMIRIAAAKLGIPQEEADPIFQAALIGLDQDIDPALRMSSLRTLLRYTYRELPPESIQDASSKELIEGGGITITWEPPQEPALPAPPQELSLENPHDDVSD